jgi:5-methyltetrahydrofolate--homocysteine methyltransferase
VVSRQKVRGEIVISREQKERIENWWNFGEQDRPLIFCSCWDPQKPPLDEITDLNSYWNSTDAIVGREMQKIERTLWFGEAVPYHYPEFGAAALSIMLGAGKEYIKTESIWAVEKFETVDQLTDISLNGNHDFYDLVWGTMKKSLESSKDHHLLGMYCPGSPVDTLAGLMGTQNALLSLISDPGRSKKVLDKIFAVQVAEFEKYIAVLHADGYEYSTGWYGLWCGGRGTAIQEDCSCMLSSEFFREFCLPYVRDFIHCMDHSFYHLDGPDAARHLPIIRQIPDLYLIHYTRFLGRHRMDYIDKEGIIDIKHTNIKS